MPLFMKYRVFVWALAACFAALAGPFAALAKCPLEPTDFVLAGIGKTSSLFRYELTFRATSDAATSAQLLVSSVNAPPTPVSVDSLVYEEHAGYFAATITFAIPARYATGVSVKQVVEVKGNQSMSCSDPESRIDPSSDVPEFDDTSSAARALVAAEPLVADPLTLHRLTSIPPQTLSRVAPNYPMSEREQMHQGTAFIEVLIGAGGAIVQARVIQSSGWKKLDEEALRAAKASTYAGLSSGGKPVAAKYKLDYAFTLE